MSLNTIDISQYKESTSQVASPVKQPISTEIENYGLHICQATLNMIGRLCVGVVVGICLAYGFRNGLPLNVMNQHIVLCVIGVSTLFIVKFSKQMIQ